MCRYTVSFTERRQLCLEAVNDSAAVIQAIELLANDPERAVRSIDELVSIQVQDD